MATLSQNEKMQENRNGNLGLFALLVALVLIAAFAVWQFARPAAPVGPTPGGELETAHALWEDQGIDSYRYDLQVGCFCIRELTRPVTIEVRDGEVAAITYVDDGTAADAILFENFSTMARVFDVLAQNKAQDPVVFDVTYDASLGIPLDVAIDISEMMADEELWLTVSNFATLQ